MTVGVDTLAVDLEAKAASARSSIREVERFAYRIVSDADDPESVAEARVILRMSVGLRRKLDTWRK